MPDYTQARQPPEGLFLGMTGNDDNLAPIISQVSIEGLLLGSLKLHLYFHVEYYSEMYEYNEHLVFTPPSPRCSRVSLVISRGDDVYGQFGITLTLGDFTFVNLEGLVFC